MWCEFFVIGGVFFWLLAIIITVLLTALIEWERPVLSGFTLIFTFLVLAFLGNFNIFAEIQAHPFISLGVFVGYFAVGTLYSIGRWWLFIHNRTSGLKKLKKEFLEFRKLPAGSKISRLDRERKKEWRSALRGINRGDFHKPEINENKRKILTWMVYWPWSFVWTILNDPVTKLFKQIFNQLRFIYEEITARAYASLEDDLAAAEDDKLDDFDHDYNRELEIKDGGMGLEEDLEEADEDNDDKS